MKNYLELLLIIVCLGVSKLIILFQRFHEGRGKSFIYKRKSKGPSMLLCGIPYLIFCAEDS
jgi:hypothetical protein